MSAALSELWLSLKMARVWLYFGISDTKIKYRRSVLGPLWHTLGTAIMVAGMGALWSLLWNLPVREFLPYVAAGLITWIYLVGMASEGCWTFINQSSVIKNIPIPIWVHPLRQSTRGALLYMHNLLVFVVVALVFQVPMTGWTALFPVALLVFFCNAVWVSAAVGLLSARLRDIPPIVEYVMPLFLFLTPILWRPEALGSRAHLADLNPFTHYIEIVRAPLLGLAPRPESWIVVLCITAGGVGFALALFARARKRLAFWL